MYNDPNSQSNRRTKKPANSFGIPKANWNTKPTLPSSGYFNQPRPQKAEQGVGAPGDIQQEDVNTLNRLDKLNKLYGKPTSALAQQNPSAPSTIPASKPDTEMPPTPGPRPGPSPYAENDNGSTMFGMAGDTSAMLPHMNPYSMKSGAAMSTEDADKLAEMRKQTAAMNDLRGKMSPEQLRADIASGKYSTPDPKVVADAEARYLAEQGPTGRQFAEGTNTQSARMQENREGVMARAENPSLVPYGARNAVGPMSGEGELRRQEAIKNPSWMMSNEQALAEGRADVDAMKKTRDANSAEMKSRSGPGAWDGPIENPNQMRKDLQTTTDAYSIYKRRGGDMDFRTWANVHDAKTSVPDDVKRQLANNYPGIWDTKTQDGDAAAGTDYDKVAASDANPTRDKLAGRRKALLALQGGQTAQIANAVAHGANPQQAYATLQNQARQDQMLQNRMAYEQSMQKQELDGRLAIANAGKTVTPLEQLNQTLGAVGQLGDLNPRTVYENTFKGLPDTMDIKERHRIANENALTASQRSKAIMKSNPELAAYLPQEAAPDWSGGNIPGEKTGATSDTTEAAAMTPKAATQSEALAIYDSLKAKGIEPTKEAMEKALKENNLTIEIPKGYQGEGWQSGGPLETPEQAKKRKDLFKMLYGIDIPERTPIVAPDPMLGGSIN